MAKTKRTREPREADEKDKLEQIQAEVPLTRSSDELPIKKVYIIALIGVNVYHE